MGGKIRFLKGGAYPKVLAQGERIVMLDKADYGYLSMALVAAIAVPYWRLMFLGKTKPHVFSWIIWGLTEGIGAAGRYAEEAGPGMWGDALGAVFCFSVAVLGIFWGEKRITRSDVVFFVGALAAIPLWYFTADPLTAIILVVGIDVVGYYPTARKSFLRPQEEATYAYALYIVVAGLALAASETYSFATMLAPITMIVGNTLLVGMIWWRRAVTR